MPSTDDTAKLNTLTIPRPTKRLIVPIAVVIFGFCAISVYVLIQARTAAYERAADVARGLVIAIEADISRNFETVDLSLQGVVEGLALPEIDTLSPKLRHLVLFDRAATARHLGRMGVLDEKGDLRLDSTNLAPKPVNLADRDYFQAHKNNPDLGLFISRPVLSKLADFWFVGLSRRLSHADGSFAGVVVASVRTSYFEELFKRLNLSANGNITLARSDGIVLARWPFMQEYAGLDLSRADLFKHLAQSRSGRFETSTFTEGQRRLFVYSQVGNLPLVVSIGQSTEEIYFQWNEYAFGIAFLIGLLCIGTFMLVTHLMYDLNRRRAAEKQLSVLAATDALTGLANRRHFNEILGREWQRATRDQRPLALLMIDADKFKAYNDVHGHPAGDHMLKTLGAAIAGVLKRGGDTGARYGGDEFVILLSNTPLEGAKDVAAQIRANFAEHCKREHIADLGLSIGACSMTPAKGVRANELLALADHALYCAKDRGRNRTETAEPPAAQAAGFQPQSPPAERPPLTLQ